MCIRRFCFVQCGVSYTVVQSYMLQDLGRPAPEIAHSVNGQQRFFGRQFDTYAETTI
jgi:hypothetical protein